MDGGGSGEDTGDNYASLEEDPESKFIDIFDHPLEEDPELQLGSGNEDAADVDGSYDRNPPKQEPESGLPPEDDGAVASAGRGAYDCCHCGINLRTQELKVEHEFRCRVRMQRRKLESQITKLYHCGYCRCPFVSTEYREQHQQKWCTKRPPPKRRPFNGTYFECDKCEYVAKWRQSLNRHLLTHNKNNAEWFTCTQCSYKTVQKYLLAKHMKIHANTFSLCCPICGKIFRKKSCLDDHLLKQHSDESEEISKLITSKVYACNICDKCRTTSKAYFNKHLTVIHLNGEGSHLKSVGSHVKGVGTEKYKCLHCPYSTLRKRYLTTHLKTHAEQKEYQCVICKKQFAIKRGLDSHILHHHADNLDLVKTITSKMHRCKSCSFKTLLVTHLKRHVRSKHV